MKRVLGLARPPLLYQVPGRLAPRYAVLDESDGLWTLRPAARQIAVEGTALRLLLEIEPQEVRIERLLVRLLALLGEDDEADPARVGAQRVETRVGKRPLEVDEAVVERQPQRLVATVDVVADRRAAGRAVGGPRRQSGTRRLGHGAPEGDLALLVVAGEKQGDRLAELRRQVLRAKCRRHEHRAGEGEAESRREHRDDARPSPLPHASSAEGP